MQHCAIIAQGGSLMPSPDQDCHAAQNAAVAPGTLPGASAARRASESIRITDNASRTNEGQVTIAGFGDGAGGLQRSPRAR